MSTIELNGIEFDSDDFEGSDGFGFWDDITVDSVTYKRLFGLFAAGLADLGKMFQVSSATTHSLSTGSKVFTMAAARPYPVGALVVALDGNDPTNNKLWGEVTARSGTSVTINVTTAEGSGSSSDWTIQMVGQRGETGGLSGSAAGAIDMAGNGLIVDATQTDANDQGDKSSGTVTIAKTSADEQTIRLQGDITIDFTAPDSGHSYSKVFIIDNDSGGAGGRDITWNRAGTTTSIYHIGSEPVWSGQAAGVKTRVGAHYTSGGELILSYNEDYTA